MHSINKFSNGRWTSVDLHNLPLILEDGRRTWAHKLNRDELVQECIRLNVPGITLNCGWQDAAVAFGLYQQKQHELTQPEEGDSAA
jgi:hypothetical protein